MDQIKIDNFSSQHPGCSFPEWDSLSKDACLGISRSIQEKFALENIPDGLALVRAIDAMAQPCKFTSHVSEDFDLDALLDACGVDAAEVVYINWYRYDEIDRLKRKDLSDNFDEIWYPGVDDIDIFDDSLSWILSVRHNGYIKILR
jgi:hypothetical protein